MPIRTRSLVGLLGCLGCATLLASPLAPRSVTSENVPSSAALKRQATAPGRQSFTLEQVMSSPFPYGLVAAARAPRIAWVFNAKGVRNVWVADAPRFEARQVTRYAADDGMPIAALAITQDGRTVVYARGSEANQAGQVADPTHAVTEPRQQVYAADVDSGDPRLLGEMGCEEEGCEDIQLSPDGRFAVWAAKKQIWIAPLSGGDKAKVLAYARGSNEQPRWSPDSKRIAFVSDRGDHRLVAIYELGAATLRYVAPGVDRDGLPRWSPDGRQLAFVRRPGKETRRPLIPQIPEPWSIWVGEIAPALQAPASGTTTEPADVRAHVVWRSGNSLNDSYPELTEAASFVFASNGRIVFSSEQDGWNHLYSVSADGGPATLLTPGEFETEDVSLAADKSTVLYSSNQGDVDRRHLWRVPAGGGTPRQLTRGETIEWSPAETTDGSIVCLGSTATSPAMPYHVVLNGREMIARAQLPADFPSQQLVVPRAVTFKAEDGWEIHGQLFEPRTRPGAAAATLFVHGGSVRQMVLGFHYMNYYHDAYAMNQYLASLGYVVLSVNYRTGIMYGRAFREPADGGPRGAAEYKDILAAGKYLQGLPGVDAKKIGSWGGSYGGYLTALALARNSDVFAAGVDLHGVHDWNRVFGPEGLPKDAPDLEQAKKLAFESSPDAYISTWRSPVLLIQGDDDRNVPFLETVDLVQRLRAQHAPFELLVFPDEIHDFLLWRSWIAAYRAAAEFFDRTLTGK